MIFFCPQSLQNVDYLRLYNAHHRKGKLMKKMISAVKTVLSRYLADELVETILKELRQELLKERDAA